MVRAYEESLNLTRQSVIISNLDTGILVDSISRNPTAKAHARLLQMTPGCSNWWIQLITRLAALSSTQGYAMYLQGVLHKMFSLLDLTVGMILIRSQRRSIATDG